MNALRRIILAAASLTALAGFAFAQWALVVYAPPIADSNNQHEQLPVANLANDAVIARPVAPQARELSFQPFPSAARIVATGYALVEEGNDLPMRIATKFAQFFQRSFVESIGPAHALLQPLNTSSPVWQGALQRARHLRSLRDVRAGLRARRRLSCGLAALPAGRCAAPRRGQDGLKS
jgi:hypothetical protein